MDFSAAFVRARVGRQSRVKKATIVLILAAMIFVFPLVNTLRIAGKDMFVYRVARTLIWAAALSPASLAAVKMIFAMNTGFAVRYYRLGLEIVQSQ